MITATAFNYQTQASTQIAARAKAAPAGDKPNLASVERNYQVPTEKMKEWSPKVFGWIPTGGIFGSRQLTVTEGKLLDNLTRDRGVLGLKRFEKISNEALETAGKRFPPSATLPAHIKTSIEAEVAKLPKADQAAKRAELTEQKLGEWMGQDGHMDAFRHALWNARLTSEFGASWTKQFTTAHEGSNVGSSTREAMDLYNNEVGRKIATDNPKASAKELEALVKQALDDGKLVVIDRNGHLAWSNTVALNDHGLSVKLDGQPVIPTPKGDAYAGR
jgi:hypothetical protein